MTEQYGRYILPTFTERTSYGFKELSPYTKLFEERIIFLGAPIDDTSANDVMAQLIAEHTGQTVDQIEKDSDRDRWFSAEEAKEYGFVDHVFSRSDQAVEGKGVGQADAKAEN